MKELVFKVIGVTIVVTVVGTVATAGVVWKVAQRILP